jgi:hypothetical protein
MALKGFSTGALFRDDLEVAHLLPPDVPVILEAPVTPELTTGAAGASAVDHGD